MNSHTVKTTMYKAVGSTFTMSPTCSLAYDPLLRVQHNISGSIRSSYIWLHLV